MPQAPVYVLPGAACVYEVDDACHCVLLLQDAQMRCIWEVVDLDLGPKPADHTAFNQNQRANREAYAGHSVILMRGCLLLHNCRGFGVNYAFVEREHRAAWRTGVEQAEI